MILPTLAAAATLRSSLEGILFGGSAPRDVFVLPELLTREGWYARMHERLGGGITLLTSFEREVLFQAAARTASAVAPPPFSLRAGLIPEILSFYDALQRRRVNVDTFERRVFQELGPAEGDRGAERLLQQTRFLGAAFREYDRRLSAGGFVDEHVLRGHLKRVTPQEPFRRLVVAVGDEVAEPAGLWAADFDLLTQMPGLEAIDVLATEAQLAAGYYERLHEWLPGIEEEAVAVVARAAGASGAGTRGPFLLIPSAPQGPMYFVNRDREEELVAVAKEIKSTARAVRVPGQQHEGGAPLAWRALDRSAVVFQRPLPYLYLARQVFGAAGIPWQAYDALPLAAEPYAAVLDLVCTFVTARYTRGATIALLRSPHLSFEVDGEPITPEEVAALDRALHEARYLGNRDRLTELADRWTADKARADTRWDERASARAARAAANAAEALQTLEADGPAVDHLDALLRFVNAHERPLQARDPSSERHLRARRAILMALESLKDAHARHDPVTVPFRDLVASIRRWIEAQTFAPRTGAAGLHLVDEVAARYGDFDEVRLVGLIEGEWPERSRPSVFYPAKLLGLLGWPAEASRLRAHRAAFADLMNLPAVAVSLSTFSLENDAIVGPSAFLEEIDGSLVPRRAARPSVRRIFSHEALSIEPVAAGVASGEAAEWVGFRLGRTAGDRPEYHGFVGSRAPDVYAPSAVERYLACPFKFFAGHVLRLKEELEDELTLTPLTRGRFLHAVFQDFFREWSATGEPITLDTLERARAMFAGVTERQLTTLPELDRPLERMRLLGSAAATGLGERVLRLEIERPGDLVERLLEFGLDGDITLTSEAETRTIRLRGTADRIDLFADGTFRLIDYKTGRAPERREALQLPVYTVAARERLKGRGARDWEPSDAGYVAFGERDPFVSMVRKTRSLASELAEGELRFLEAIDQIERGEFPPRPTDVIRCEWCGYTSVCRKDYADEE